MDPRVALVGEDPVGGDSVLPGGWGVVRSWSFSLTASALPALAVLTNGALPLTLLGEGVGDVLVDVQPYRFANPYGDPDVSAFVGPVVEVVRASIPGASNGRG